MKTTLAPLLCAEAATFSPAMTLSSHTGTVTFNDAYTCTSSDPGAATASSGGGYTGATYSCIQQISPIGATGAVSYTWADSTTSTLTYTSATETFVGGSYSLTAVGTVTSGKFAGGVATLVIVDPTLSVLQCLTTGISSITGTAALTITST